MQHLRQTKTDTARIPAVETRILKPNIDPSIDPQEMVYACYDLATAGIALDTARQCSTLLEKEAVHAALLARLKGTISYQENDNKAAALALNSAAKLFAVAEAPLLHLRLATALGETGQKKAACTEARELFSEHPLLSGAQQLLKNCGGSEKVAAEIHAEQRKQLLSKRRDYDSPAPLLDVEDLAMRGYTLQLADSKKITIAMFFATWCPHCQVEFPRITQFVRSAQKNVVLKGNVRVLGIRTAVEKETEPYDSFVKQFAPNFTVWTDATMALAFSKFAKSQGISAGLPTLAVIDRKGMVRYLLESGDYRDTERELTWAVESLLNKTQGK